MQPFLDSHRWRDETPNLDKFHMQTHDNYEIYCFLSGIAEYFVEGSIYKLKPGDILIIKKSEAHSLLIRSNVPYERIVINFNLNALLEENAHEAIDFLDNKPLGKNNRYAAAKFKDMRWLYYLDMICTSSSEYEKRLYLTILLRELKKKYSEICEESIKADSTSDIIEFINSHLCEELSLDKISEKFYISKSQLNRKFKRITGCTVWEYISTKRLILAKELLQNGEHPTTVYIKSGFKDYCSFFRAYKIKFGVSPKADLNHNIKS